MQVFSHDYIFMGVRSVVDWVGVSFNSIGAWIKKKREKFRWAIPVFVGEKMLYLVCTYVCECKCVRRKEGILCVIDTAPEMNGRRLLLPREELLRARVGPCLVNSHGSEVPLWGLLHRNQGTLHRQLPRSICVSILYRNAQKICLGELDTLILFCNTFQQKIIFCRI